MPLTSLGGILHLVVGLVLLLYTGAQELLLAVLGLLVLLDQAAAVAAARGEDVLEARALQVVLVADVHALHGHGDPVKTKAASAAEEEALFARLLVVYRHVFLTCFVVQRRTEVLMGSYPSRLAFLRTRW